MDSIKAPIKSEKEAIQEIIRLYNLNLWLEAVKEEGYSFEAIEEYFRKQGWESHADSVYYCG